MLRRRFVLGSFFALELAILCVAHLPGSLTLDQFAFCDAGANLTIHNLIARGLSPAVDFGFNYGLLTILVTKVWFAIFGSSPFAYQALMFAANLAVVWACASIATRLEFGPFGLALLFVGLAFATQATYPEAAQALEAALIALALAQQAAGRHDRALAISVAAVLVKPSMGYFYALLLIGLMIRKQGWRGLGKRDFWLSLRPAATVGLVLLIVLTLIYGPHSLINTALPLNGARSYKQQHFGFFGGSGREFWLQPGKMWLFYLFDVSGFWIGATAALFVATALWTLGAIKEGLPARKFEIVATCAVLHLIFILVLFGNQWSWFYYSYILVIGVAAAADWNGVSRRVALALCIAAGFAWFGRARALRRLWRIWQQDSVAAGLWSYPAERAEWQRVRELARGSNTVMVDSKGAAEILFPDLEQPVTLYLDPGWMLAADIDRKVQQLSTAEMVIVPWGIDPEVCRGVPDSPELRDSLANFEPAYQGRYFELLRRRSLAARTASSR